MSTPPAAPPGVVLVTTKLHVPEVRPGLVSREELVARLVAGAGCRLSLVCAPAGWGKTFLLSQWHASEAERRPFAWVSLDPGDDDPVRFWSYVIAALRTVAPGFGGAALATLPTAGPGLIEVVLPKLINELASLPQSVVLVLDDYHLLRDKPVHASVTFLLRHLPRTLQLAITTRADPPLLPLARLRAAGELVEIRADELRFSDSEAEALLNGSLALELEAAEVGMLQERTEGWPAGLQLAALSLRGRVDRGAFIRAFAGDDRQIGDYLHEVIEDAPRELREFLLRTSILERLCPPLCDAVTGGGGDARALLAEAYRSNLFLVALDDRGHWFRYHHLFRDLLRNELARGEPELVATLHARAFAWHHANGDVEAAIGHAIAAGALDDAQELIALHWRPAWHENPRTVARWLDALPPQAMQADARLCLARGWTSLFLGRLDEVEPAARAAEQGERSASLADELGSLEANAALLRSALAYLLGDVGRANAMARLARTGSQRERETMAARAVAGMLLGMTSYFAGDPDGAREPLERTRTSLPAPGWGQALLTTLGVLACLNADAGEPAAAAGTVEDAERLIADFGLGESPTASIVHVARGKLLGLRGDPAGAGTAYARAVELARRGGWRLDLAHALILQAGLQRRRRDHAGARELARDARRVLATCPDPGMLAELLERTERALALTPVRGAAPALPADAELSEREIAVLRLLATDLSQREIGSELYVSFNTVKSHTRTLFRKLGVASRADAVARGRALGVL